jgi:hypothetical protein
MLEVVRLAPADCLMLASRYAEHANSHIRMSTALVEAGADDAAERLYALRQIERQFDVDLGMLCHWYEQRDAAETHPVQRAIIQYLTARQDTSNSNELLFRLDRVRELRELLEESRLVGEPES